MNVPKQTSSRELDLPSLVDLGVIISTKIKDSVPLLKVKKSDTSRKLKGANRGVVQESSPPKKRPHRAAPRTGSRNPVCDEIWEVKALDPEMKITSRPSRVLEKLTESRRQRQEEALQSLYNDLDSINKTAEEVIVRDADILKADINELSQTAARIYEQISYKPVFLMEENETKNMYAQIEELFSNRKNLVDAYANSLMENEKNRLQKSKDVFKKYANIFNKIAHKLPFENQEFFEHEILKYNKFVLNNIRSYSDVNKQLLLVGDTELQKYRRYLDYMDYQRKDWMDKKALIQETSVETLLSESYLRLEKDKEMQRMRSQMGIPKEGMFQSVITRWTAQPDSPFTRANVTDWSDNLALTIQHLDSCTHQILTLYCNILMNLVQENISIVGKLELNVDENDLFNARDIDELRVILISLEEQLQVVPQDELDTAEGSWIKQLCKMQESMEATQKFLLDATQLWERHLERLGECLKIVCAGTSRDQDMGTAGLDEKESRLNVAIDSLRQESSPAKLGKGMEKVQTVLDEIEEEYKKCYEKQVGCLRSYPDMVKAEMQVLTVEVDTFSKVYPREVILASANSFLEIRRDRYLIEVTRIAFMDKEANLCDHQITTVGNWKFGLWEGMQHYLLSNKDHIVDKAWTWVNEESEKMFQELEGKLMMHSTRSNRIKQEVHHVRLTELTSHSYRLDGHVQGIKLHLKDINKDLEDLTSSEQDLKSDFETKLQALAETGRNAPRSANVFIVMKKMDDILDIYIRDVKAIICEFQEESDSKTSWLRESNVEFMKALTLFSEGGNFSAKEADEFMGQLQDIDSVVDKQEGASMKQVDSQEIALIKEGRNLVGKSKNEMQGVYGELLFGEKVVSMIKAVQTAIKSEVAKMKHEGRRLREELAEGAIGLDDDQLIDHFLEQLPARKQYLLQPPTMRDGTKIAEAGLKFGGFEMDASQQENLSKLEKGSDRYLDYRELLFSWSEESGGPSDVDMFLPRVCFCMWQTFGKIQEAACDFYDTARVKPLLKPDVIQATYDDFIEEMLLKFKYYHVQCEEVWLDQAQDYLNVVAKLKRSASDFITQCLSKFHQDKVTILENNQKKLSARLQKTVVEGERVRRELFDRLEVQSGHPANEHLLAELEGLVLAASQEIQDKVDHEFEQVQQSFKQLYELHVPTFSELEDPLNRLAEKIFDQTLTSVLVDQIEEVYISVLQRADRSRKDEEAVVMPEVPESITSATDIGNWTNTRLLKGMHHIVNSPSVAEEENRPSEAAGDAIPRQHLLSIEHDAYFAQNVLARLQLLREETVRASEREDTTTEGTTEDSEGSTAVESEPLDEDLCLTAVPVDQIIANMTREFNAKYEEGQINFQNIVTNLSALPHDTFRAIWEEEKRKVRKLFGIPCEDGVLDGKVEADSSVKPTTTVATEREEEKAVEMLRSLLSSEGATPTNR